MIVLIEAGCAECRGWDDVEPLITLRQFETVQDAVDWANEQQWLRPEGYPPLHWEDHPQGGSHVVVGQGSVWITDIPVSEETPS